MQKIMKTLILLFSLVSFYTVLSNAKPISLGGHVMVEDAAVGMSAGFTNTFSFSDEDNLSKDDESEKDEDVKNGSRDTNAHGLKNGGKSDVVKHSPQNGSDRNEKDEKNDKDEDVYAHGLKNGGKSDVVKHSPQNGVDENIQVHNNKADPKNPNTAALINEWISLAKPPINATECAQTRYEAWGRAVGRTNGAMVIQASGKPDNVGGRSSVEYLWSMRDQLDSVDHCTLGEYVTAKLGNQSISHCKGRYKPKGPKANELLGEGRQYWNQGKLDQAIDHISEEQKHVCDDQKVNKALSAMKRQKNDIDKRLKKTSSFIHNEKLDEAEKSLSKAAVISTKYERYVEVKQELEDARKKFHEDKIADIRQQAQEQAQRNANSREHDREEEQRDDEIRRHAEEQLQREIDERKHISDKAVDARREAAAQAQKNANARRDARIKAAEDKKRAQRRAEERRIARNKEEARKRAQRKADAMRRARNQAEARRRAEIRAHKDAEARRQAYINAQREAERRRRNNIKMQQEMNRLMYQLGETVSTQRNRNTHRHTPTRTHTPTHTHSHTHSHTHHNNSNSNNLNFLGVEAHSAPNTQ
jgi:hypothetical protein